MDEEEVLAPITATRVTVTFSFEEFSDLQAFLGELASEHWTGKQVVGWPERAKKLGQLVSDAAYFED